jgi:hypothetical protein
MRQALQYPRLEHDPTERLDFLAEFVDYINIE